MVYSVINISFIFRIDPKLNKNLTTSNLTAALNYITLKCQHLRPLAKQVEYRQKTMEYARQKGRFLDLHEFSKLFDNVLNDLNGMFSQQKVIGFI